MLVYENLIPKQIYNNDIIMISCCKKAYTQILEEQSFEYAISFLKIIRKHT